MEKKEKNNLVFILAFCLFLLLFFMCIQTPLAGDDWGYAINGTRENAFSFAIEFYKTWSGRFFSELYGFFMAPRKWIWNIFNPSLFTVILLLLVFCTKKQRSVKAAIAIVLILWVNNYLRMETYTWLMGTTYVIPLALSLLYFTLVSKYKDKKGMIVYTNIILFYIGLTIENIAGIMILATIAMNINYYIENKKVDKLLLSNFIISTISLIIMRISPGSAYRLLSDHPSWVSLTLIEKINLQIPKFISYTFLDNKVLLFVLGAILVCLGLKNYKNIKQKVLLIVCEIIVCFSFVMLLSSRIYNVINIEIFDVLNNPNNIVNLVLWILYTIAVYIVIILCAKTSKYKALFFLTLGGAGNVAMLLSPIFDARSSLYFVFFTILTILILLDEFDLQYYKRISLIVICIGLSLIKSMALIEKYNEVSKIYIENMYIIDYYGKEFEFNLYRMPPYSIHGFDIEDNDEYHMTVFKKYYNINPYATLHFLYKDTYK